MLSGPWPRCPEAAAFFAAQFDTFAQRNTTIAALRERLYREAAVDLLALVDHWILPEGSVAPERLTALGLTETILPEGDRVWEHPGARLPRLRFKKRDAPTLALRVEDIPAFSRAQGLPLSACHGDSDSSYQCGHLPLEWGELMPIARRGSAGFAPGTVTDAYRDRLSEARQAFRARPRTDDEEASIAAAQEIFARQAAALGPGRAVDEFFAAEREYYLARNAAARWQCARQEKAGIGWANHDHHTFRSSRPAFRALVNLFQTMGFLARERFYAGAEAGWGAQVFEHPQSRVVIFADVDIAPEELDLDFSRAALAPRESLATIGLWCALHTSSIARAGLHHLECEFDCKKMRDDCLAAGIGVMAPFTDLPMLWQAFTEAEPWKVAPERLSPLTASGAITTEQAERFATVGAAGSHLEILQRWEGFKGFNKTGVSAIIRETDARLQAGRS